MPSRFFLERRAARAFGLKDYEKALDALSDLLSVVGENSNTLHVAAVCHQRLGQLDEAIDFATRGITSDPGHLGCLEVLAESHVSRGDPDAAREFARRALDRVASLDTDGAPSGNFVAWLASMLNPPGPATSSRASTPEWIRWANGLLKNRPGVGKS